MNRTDWRDLTMLPLHSDKPDTWHAAKVLGISRWSAYEAASNGTIPAIRVGRRLLVPTAKLRQMLGESEQEATPNLDARRALADDLRALADALSKQPVAS